MRSKLIFLLVIIISIFSQVCHGKNANKTKINDNGAKKPFVHKKNTSSRLKRAIGDLDEKTFIVKNNKDFDPSSSQDHTKDDIHPFWGTRGRRDSSSQEYDDIDPVRFTGGNKKCKHCFRPNKMGTYLKIRRDDDEEPFWGNRGRRSSEEFDANSQRFISSNIGSRDTLDDDQFWGARGRRIEDTPFWGTRGRRENILPSDFPDKSNIPFWSSRGRRDDDSEPFWGNRGRRDDIEPFWGNRGRRDDIEPFWGNRGKKKEYEYLDDISSQEKMKETLLKAIRVVENDISNKISRGRRSQNFQSNSFWSNRGRDSQLKSLFNGAKYSLGLGSLRVRGKPAESSTVRDDRIYAEQPSYILVERSSRSSAEVDPFYISRGKKELNNYEVMKAVRDRRGAFEDLVNSVKNDPYYIARGKKDDKSDVPNDKLGKVKEFICATVGLVTKNKKEKVKRDITDSDRDRRTTLKKLAAQLQIDPYFVSRGKKDGDFVANDYNIENFIKDIARKCYM